MKTCTLCKQSKSLQEFSLNKRNKSDGRQPKCKACNAAYFAARADKIKKRVNDHYHANHEEMLKRRAELRQRKEAKAKKRILDKNWKINNREHYNKMSIVHCSNRRARLKNAGKVSSLEIFKLFNTQKHCAYCNVQTKLTIDHIVSLNKGGPHRIDNIVLACTGCNSSKQDKDLDVWLKQRSVSPDGTRS